jgi:hypothetical protein
MSILQVTCYWLVFCYPLAHLANRFEDRSKSAILDWAIVTQSTLYGAALAERVTTV